MQVITITIGRTISLPFRLGDEAGESRAQRNRSSLQILVKNSCRSIKGPLAFSARSDPTKPIKLTAVGERAAKAKTCAIVFPVQVCRQGQLSQISGALDSLNNWTDSAGVFVRFAPDTKIVPALISGVIWQRAARHWLTRIKRTRDERERLAAALQLLAMVVRDARPVTPHIRFAKPITLDEVGSTDSKAIHQVVIERMRGLIQSPMEGAGVSAL